MVLVTFFPQLKFPLRGHPLGSVEATEEKTLDVLKTVQETEYTNCFEDWKKH